MPGVSVLSAQKNVSKSKRASMRKNTNRIEAAVRGDIEDCTYGRIYKALGNKMFIVINSSKKERLAHIRGKMARIGVDDVVLLNVREYETRAGTDKEVYDIMAVFDKRDVARLIKDNTISGWMALSGTTDESEEDVFDYSDSKIIDLEEEELNIDDI